MTSRVIEIAQRFGNASAIYDEAAKIQSVAASRLARRIADTGPAPKPLSHRLKVLEIGCGTGLLTRALRKLLPDADWIVTDLSEAMLHRCRNNLGLDDGTQFLVMDGEHPCLDTQFDVICGGLALQWFADGEAALRKLASHLRPGGLLALSTICEGSFAGWAKALEMAGEPDTMLNFASLQTLQAAWPDGGRGDWETETLIERHESGIAFLRSLRAIGADLPRSGSVPKDPLELRRAVRRFEREHGGLADYRIGYGLYRRDLVVYSRPRGVFVTGTDTGVGKTVVSACLVAAWDANYWKPLQTGLAEEQGDSATVAQLAGLVAERILPPVAELQAPLSPQAAAEREAVTIDLDRLVLPHAGSRPVVVEGAGGLMVPIAGEMMMIDLIANLGLPVVLVARGTLGTINHTLLSLDALRARAIEVAGVVLNGACSQSNRDAIARHGRVRILAQLPALHRLDPTSLQDLARMIPAFEDCMKGCQAGNDARDTSSR